MTADNYDDLRAQLPDELRTADVSAIPGIWVAWRLALHGKPASELAEAGGISHQLAARIQALVDESASRSRHDSGRPQTI